MAYVDGSLIGVFFAIVVIAIGVFCIGFEEPIVGIPICLLGFCIGIYAISVEIPEGYVGVPTLLGKVEEEEAAITPGMHRVNPLYRYVLLDRRAKAAGYTSPRSIPSRERIPFDITAVLHWRPTTESIINIFRWYGDPDTFQKNFLNDNWDETVIDVVGETPRAEIESGVLPTRLKAAILKKLDAVFSESAAPEAARKHMLDGVSVSIPRALPNPTFMAMEAALSAQPAREGLMAADMQAIIKLAHEHGITIEQVAGTLKNIGHWDAPGAMRQLSEAIKGGGLLPPRTLMLSE